MAPPPKGTVRGTSPHERGNTRANTTPDVASDRGVDLGGVWDEHGNYWYADESARTWLWQESTQQWQLFSGPEQAIRMTGRAPLTDEDRAYVASRDAMLKRHYGVPARQFGETSVMGGPGRVVAKMGAEAWSRVQEHLPTGALAQPATVFLSHNAERFLQTEKEIIEDNKRRDAEAEARNAHAHGELFQMLVAVASNDRLEQEHEAAVAAGTTKKVGSPVRAPARVEGFINDLTRVYRAELVAAKADEPKATASRHGARAEARALARVPEMARARGLNPGHIMVNNFIVGVTGPRGGALSAEMGSPHYGFIVELKKSPRAVRGWQAQGHLIAVDHSLNFKHGGVYIRIYGENYKPGAGVDRRAMGGALGKKPKQPRRPRTRIK